MDEYDFYSWTNKIIFSIILILVSYFFFFSFLVPFLACHFGQPTQGIVKDIWISRGRHTFYKARVEYTDETKNEIGIINIKKNVFDSLRINQRVDIHFFSIFHGTPSLDLSPPSLLELLVIMFAFLFACAVTFVSFMEGVSSKK